MFPCPLLKTKNGPGTTAHTQSLLTFLPALRLNFGVFTPLFHCCTSKFTTTTAQLRFYNCKLRFTTAQIVISCTLKYALQPIPVFGRASMFSLGIATS